MDRPMNLEHHRKQSISLQRAYILVGVVGVVMLVFIVTNYINARLLNELTSPLWTAAREVKLEATAVQHEATALLRGEMGPDADALWFYLDQSIWHLANLLKSHQQSSLSWLFTEKLDVGGRVEAITGHLVQMKAFMNAHKGQVRTPEARAEMIMRFDELAVGFRSQLDELEADISGLMLKEQLQQRISYAVLVVFCVTMIALVAYQIRRYERYRKESYETVSGANRQLARQIEERQRAEAALKESENLFRTIFDTSPDAIMLSRLADNVIVDVNPGFTELTGYGKEEVVGKSPDAIPRWKDFNLRDSYSAALGTGRPVHNVEFHVHNKEGHIRTALVSANNVDFGQVTHLVAVARDISDLKAAENDLRVSYEFMKIANDNREIRQMLSQFTASIQSHAGCSTCSIRLVNDDGEVQDDPSPAFDPNGMGCELDLTSMKLNRSMCARVMNKDIDPRLTWFTPFGSYFLDRTRTGGGSADAAPETCEQIRCARKGYRSLALVPIKVGEQVIGLILVADTADGLLSRVIVERIETASMHLGAAIRRLRAEKGLETAYHELEIRVSERTQALSDMNRELQTEIEERRLVEDRLRKNRNTLQTLIDGIGDSLILVDMDMKIRMLNQMAAKAYQVGSLDSVVGKLCCQEIGPAASCADCAIPLAVQRRENLTFERQGVFDAERLERITIFPLKEADDASGGAIIRICDITEEKRFEQQLIQSEKMASLGILVSSIGHEINNPNNFITFNIPILREYLEALTRISDQHADTQPDFELFHMSYDEFRKDVFKLVDNIEHGASRISNFVSNLREFSQSNGNREKVWLELPAVIDKVLSICRSQIRKRVRNFKIDIPNDQPRIYADEYSMEQVLLNLIVNAVQAADKVDSAVRVSASMGESWQDTTIIAVSDNGCGIDEKKLGKIFNPFFTTKSASEGTGLGLYVCHNLVQRLGGRIEAVSKKGQGSTFTIFLPDKERRVKARD